MGKSGDMRPKVIYRFRVRDSDRGKWHCAATKMSLEHVRLDYGEGNYEKVDGSQEILELRKLKPSSSFRRGTNAAS